MSTQDLMIPRKLNYQFQKFDAKDVPFQPKLMLEPIPESFSLEALMPPVLDQGSLGACVSNASSNALHFCILKEKAYEFIPCRLFIYYNGRELAGYPIAEDSGLQIRDAAKAIVTYYTCDEKNWPYIISKFAEKPPENAYTASLKHSQLKYYAVSPDLTSLKTALCTGFPLVFGIQVYQSFMTEQVATSGQIPMPDVVNESLSGGHCILMCGFDDTTQKVLIQNSWGTSWGLNGFAWMPYTYITGVDSTGAPLASDYWTFRFFD